MSPGYVGIRRQVLPGLTQRRPASDDVAELAGTVVQTLEARPQPVTSSDRKGDQITAGGHLAGDGTDPQFGKIVVTVPALTGRGCPTLSDPAPGVRRPRHT